MGQIETRGCRGNTIEVSNLFESEYNSTNVTSRGGYMNTIHKVERKDGGCKKEPNVIIIRTSGSENSQRHHDPSIREEIMKLTEAEEILVVNEMSRLKQCPKLIGLFERGRVEEFRKMRFISPDEVLMPKFMEDSAKAFARMHLLQLPLSRKKWEPFWKRAYEGFKTNSFMTWAKRLAEEGGYEFSACLSLRYEEEVLWLNQVRQKYFDSRSRIGFIQDDTHYMNLVVNEEPREGELNVFLLDYELGSYGPRGLDLGAHFFNREMNFQDMEKVHSGKEMHTEEERKQFLKFYQEEIKRLGIEDFDDQGIDSIDNLLFESYVGALLYHVFFTYIGINCSREEDAAAYPTFPLFCNIFSSVYIKCKNLAIEKYPFLDPKVLMSE